MSHFLAATKLFLERPLASVFGAVALALGLVLAGVSWWVLGVAGNATAALDEQVILRARLDPTLDEAATKNALLALAAVKGVKSVQWVGPEAQRAELQQVLGDELLAGLDDAVFPKGGLAKVALERGVIADRAALEALQSSVAALDAVAGIEKVPYDPRHLEVLFAAASVARWVGLGLALLALLAGALAIHQRVSLALAARSSELAIYRAFGAAEGWLMARYFALALAIGVLAAALAILASWVIDGPLADLAALLPGNASHGMIGPVFFGGAIAGALGIAAAAGFHAVGRERRRTADR